MGTQQELQDLLVDLTDGGPVYFQPPPTTEMNYPCIRYKRDSANTDFADNAPYTYQKRYQLVVISRRPDSTIPDKVAMLPKCVFDRFYTSDGLNHDVFNIFF